MKDKVILHPNFDQVYLHFPNISNFGKDHYAKMRNNYPEYFHKYSPLPGPGEVYYTNDLSQILYFEIKSLVVKHKIINYLVDDLFLIAKLIKWDLEKKEYNISLENGITLDIKEDFLNVFKKEAKDNIRKWKVLNEKKNLCHFSSYELFEKKLSDEKYALLPSISLPFSEVVIKGKEKKPIVITDPALMNEISQCIENFYSKKKLIEKAKITNERKPSLKLQCSQANKLFRFLSENTKLFNKTKYQFIGEFFTIISYPFKKIQKETKQSEEEINFSTYLKDLLTRSD